MKDSGIEWIGQIPEHWDIKRNKYNFELGKDIVGTKSSKMQLLSLTKYGIKAINEDEQSGKVPTSFNTYQRVHINDLVMCLFDLDVSAVFSGLSAYEGMISPAYKCFKCKNHIYPKYVDYYFKTVFVDRKYKKYSKNVRFSINADEFMALPIVVPPQAEQQKIADYLDKKCGEIDAITAKIQEQITTLEEYKKSIISETVTKGLNPNAPVKDSGIEWIGKIPANWDVHPIYSYFTERKHKNSLGRENNLLSLSYGKIRRKDINTNGGLLPESFNTYNIIEAGDIIIRPTDLQNDKRSLRTGLSHEHGIITSAYIALRPNKDVNSRYFHYLLYTYDIQKVFYNMGNGVRQGLNFSEFAKLMVFAPSPTEQQKIADYLDRQCSQVEEAIADKQKQIETLEEYKKTLIYEYVTGKKEVA